MVEAAATAPRMITSIDVHAEGEPGRVLLGSHLLVREGTWSERMQWCRTQLEWLRRLLLREPRGHPSTCAVLVLPPLDPTADVGIIILEQGGFRPMSGSNSMCAVTALLETGSLPAAEPETLVRIDTESGWWRPPPGSRAGGCAGCGCATCLRSRSPWTAS